MQNNDHPKGNFIGLIPLIFFLILYISSGIITRNFDNMPLLIAMILASIVALALKGDNKNDTFEDKLTVFFKGAGQETMILMIVIFMLAGGFYYVTKSMHAVETVTNIGLTYLPRPFLVPGVFILGCIISFAMGTSMALLRR
ncbi:hypothetical protein [Secundilactobacillus paracollinoides]|uniref:hypothetical protein n=1 Tax=Secundilactobacillus paracollinoides TaxID=240427 RepID=UPI0006D0F3E2|nr:hypothetical protein [Secundilactobacillus paracollinoides]